MKAVIYARYSSDNQREESIEGQIRECTAFAEKNSITILRHYIDRAFSAKTDNRPEFQNMIKDRGKRLFDMIIVWKLDRFARNRYDSARYKATLKKNGVKVVSATEVISDGAEGIILESVLEGYAEYYSADLSEKVVRGMTENALKSKYNGGTCPIGYLIDSDQCFQLDPPTAPFVREAFQRYDEGATMTQIRDWLNEQGVKNTRGQKMTYNSVQHLLNNRRYIGEYTYRDIVVPDGIPAIVPQDLFDRVQEKLAKNKKAPARHKAEDDYLLTTKLFCGYCGAYLCGESGTSHTGNVHHYYKCVSVKKKRTECHKKSVRKEWIEDLVVSETMRMVMDDEAIEAIVSMLMDLQDRENVNLPLYEQQLREVDTAIQNLLNAIQEGILTKSTKGRLEELEATKEELETKIACEKLAKPKVSAEFMTFWLHRFRKLDVRQKSHRKMLIDTFINAIFLYDDKMVITFNYKEGTTTITFDDLKTALADQKTGSDLDCSTAPRRSKVSFAPAFCCLCFCGVYQDVHALVYAQAAGVEADVVVLGEAPLVAGIVAVVGAALVVLLLKTLFRLFRALAVEPYDTVGTESVVRVEERVQAVVSVPQYVVRAAAHDNAALVLREVLDDVVLYNVELVGYRQAAAARAFRVHDPVEQKAAGGAGVFAALEYVALRKAAFLRYFLYELLVVICPAQPLGSFLCDGPAAAAELAADGYDPYAHFCASFFWPLTEPGRVSPAKPLYHVFPQIHIFFLSRAEKIRAALPDGPVFSSCTPQQDSHYTAAST